MADRNAARVAWRLAAAGGAALALLAGGAQAVTPLVVAGGGGGAGGEALELFIKPGADGAATTSGTVVLECRGCTLGVGGVDGFGGPGGGVSDFGNPIAGGGGGAVYGSGGAGAGTLATAGNTFLGDTATAGWGGAGYPSFAGGLGLNFDGVYANGGFGGGGGGGLWGGGGGGGYSGGGGSDEIGGGGGGSFIADGLTPVQDLGGQNGTSDASVASLDGSVSINGLSWTTPGIYDYRVPTSGLLDITAIGAQGGSDFINYPFYKCPSSGTGLCGGQVLAVTGGLGALVEATGEFRAGQLLEIVVGGAGDSGAIPAFNDGGAGGGGGSFVLALPEPAAWLMMLLGFGVVGIALRSARRRGASAGALRRRPASRG
ncbi:MAG TPA: PEPxxWA-CTERM sorting domain-containing protein [Caulobacteraceae bacterium]|jgi:hypothetical protein|nr:PEPxxWA-CTERM sorting domain-containing protein [Caulobacteraceae bacterium]